jgi:hypothetical protein
MIYLLNLHRHRTQLTLQIKTSISLLLQALGPQVHVSALNISALKNQAECHTTVSQKPPSDSLFKSASNLLQTVQPELASTSSKPALNQPLAHAASSMSKTTPAKSQSVSKSKQSSHPVNVVNKAERQPSKSDLQQEGHGTNFASLTKLPGKLPEQKPPTATSQQISSGRKTQISMPTLPSSKQIEPAHQITSTVKPTASKQITSKTTSKVAGKRSSSESSKNMVQSEASNKRAKK